MTTADALHNIEISDELLQHLEDNPEIDLAAESIVASFVDALQAETAMSATDLLNSVFQKLSEIDGLAESYAFYDTLMQDAEFRDYFASLPDIQTANGFASGSISDSAFDDALVTAGFLRRGTFDTLWLSGATLDYHYRGIEDFNEPFTNPIKVNVFEKQREIPGGALAAHAFGVASGAVSLGLSSKALQEAVEAGDDLAIADHALGVTGSTLTTVQQSLRLILGTVSLIVAGHTKDVFKAASSAVGGISLAGNATKIGSVGASVVGGAFAATGIAVSVASFAVSTALTFREYDNLAPIDKGFAVANAVIDGVQLVFGIIATVAFAVGGPPGILIGSVISAINLLVDAAQALAEFIETHIPREIHGTDGDDVLHGRDGADTIYGYGGDDIIYAGGGNDTIFAGDGDDLIIPGTGRDEVNGDADTDTVNYLKDEDTADGVSPSELADRAIAGGASGRGLYIDLHGGKSYVRGGDVLSGHDYNLQVSIVYEEFLGQLGWTTDYSVTGVGGVAFGAGVKDELNSIENAFGTNLDDVIRGSQGSNYLAGGRGDDYIYGFGGDDTIAPGYGADFVSGGEGFDTLSLRIHSEFEEMERGTHTVYLYGDGSGRVERLTENSTIETTVFYGIERVFGSNGIDIIHGSSGNDQISGNATFEGSSGDKIYGYAGDDILAGNGGARLYGGIGNDTVTLQWQVVDPITDNLGFWVNLEAGRTFQMFWRDGLDASGPNANSYLDSIENVIGSNYDDLIFGDEKDNFLTGVHGDDDIFAGDGRDFLVGGKGYNKLDGGAGVDAVSYGGLTDAYGVNVRLDGGFAFERIAHSSAGHDTQRIQVDSKGLALSEGDVVTLKIAGYSVSVTVDAYNAASHRWPGLVLQTLKDSSALGNLFDVTDPVGSSWNNYITANYAFENVEVSLSVNGVDMSGTHVTQVRSSDGIGAVDELKGIENVFGSQGSDNIYGADDGNVLVGAGGNDKIYGFAGNDVLSGGEGADVLYGGDGVDTLVYNIGDTRNTGFEIDLLGDTTYNIDFSLNRISVEDTFYDFENATGGAGNDLIKGDDFANILAGAGAHDTIEGRGGDDVLIGGEGSDVLDGGDGMDIASYSDVKEVGIVANLENGVVVEKLDEGTGVFLSQVQVDSSGMTLEAGDELTFTFAGRSVSVTVDDYSAASWRWPGLIVDAVANDPVLSALFTTTTNSGSSWNNYITAKYPILGNAIGGVDLRPTLQLKDGDTASTSNLNSLLNWTYSHTVEGQNDVLKSIEGLFGTEQDDVIFGSTGDDVVSGSGGNDLIYGNGGNDALSGGAGSDTIVLGDGSDTSIATFTIKTGDHDILVLDGGTLPSIVLEAAGGLPTGFSGGYGGNILTALDGDSDPDNDYRLEIQYTGTEAGSGLNFSDITFKGTGSDGDEWFWYDFHTVILNAEGGNDTIYGADNDDQLDGGSGNDQLYGLAGNDNLLGGSGDDAVVGGAGNDTLVGGLGADWLNGGEGIDLADYSQDIEELNVESELGFEIDLTNGRAARRTHADGYEDTLINIENVYGTHLSDHIIGDTNENLLDGRGGDDIIESKGGLTTIIDGEGSDTVTGIGTGDDTYIFTANKGDTDTLNNHGGSASITVRADVSEYSGGTISFSLSQAGQYTLALAQDYSLVINSSDTLSQQDLSFEITGTDETDTIINVFGDSLILGLGGDDTLHGNWNVDRLFGGDGDDYLEGNQGNDTLFGEAGADRLNGGTGDDYFSGGGGQDLIIGGDGYDIIDYSLDETDAREGIRVDVTLTTETQRWNDGWKVGHGWGYWELEDTFSGIEGIIGTDHDDTYSTVFRDGENAVSFRGGFGTDTLEIGTVDENIDYVSVNLAGAAAAAIDQDGVTHGLTILYDVENVIGSQKAEFVSDTLADNTYQGNGGQDIFFLVGGADTVDGGADNDTVSFANLQHSVTVSLPWSESGIGSYSYTENSGSITSGTLRSVEAVIGTIFNDTITSGYHYSNTINGGQGDDDITLLSADNVVEETDRIVFNDNFGNDVVTGFQNGIDQIVFDLSDATNPTITSSQSGADTLVIVGTEGTILLKDFQADDFDSSDYSFVA